MASLLTVNLIKGDSPSWGFRLQGGKDFGTPLVIQKVIVGSPAERAGLVAGDSVIRVNATDVFNLRHKDAQDVLLRAGNSFSMTIQRGGSTWKPSVVPTGVISSPSPTINNISPVTRTSLAAKPSENIGAIGTGHNVSAKPFLNGAVNGGPKLVNNQYNTPLKLYSEESIAETLSAQTEVLSTGALGVNFKKNERNYDASKSAVLSLLKEEESGPKTPEHVDHQHHGPPGIDSSPSPVGIAGLRHVTAPENKPQPPSPQLPPGQNICADCERLIVGVFVRIKDKNLHVECFKCSTCGTSLKNVGYYNINNKLYCDIHAKLAAKNNPPAPNLVPITVPPGGKVPANAISAALASHSYPSPAPLSPKINSYQNPPSGPKPFGSVSPNYNSLPRTEAPLSPIAPSLAPSYSPVSSAVPSVSNIVWPPVQEEPELPSACPLFYPPPSQVVIKPRKKQNSENSENTEVEEINTMSQYHFESESNFSGRRSASECVETIAESVERQRLVENIMKSIPKAVSPPKQSDIKCSKAQSPPKELNVRCIPKAPSPPKIKTEKLVVTKETKELQRVEEKPQFIPTKIDNPVPKKWESQMLQALTISVGQSEEIESKSFVSETVEKTEDISRSEDVLSSIPTKKTVTALGSALAVAPSAPFNPVKASPFEAVPLPEETVPYFPPEDLFVVPVKKSEDSGKAKFRQKKDAELEKLLDDLPKPQQKLTMRAALTTAPERPFTPSPSQQVSEQTESEICTKELKHETKIEAKEKKEICSKPKKIVDNQNIPEQCKSKEICEKKSAIEKTNCQECKIMKSTETKVEKEHKIEESAKCSMKSKQEKVTIETKKQNVQFKKAEQMISLHRPEALPQYQISVKENAEADLIAIEKLKRKKELEERKKEEEQKKAVEIRQTPTIDKSATVEKDLKQIPSIVCPVIKVAEGNHHHPENSFKPVIDSNPQSRQSPAARSITPNKPLLPYYQANLVAQRCNAPVVNLLDPKSPAISRSPSPLPHCPKQSQLFTAKASNIRPKSPAQGPPDNPMMQEHIPMREDFKREGAKDSLSAFIPQYKELVEIQEENELNLGRNMRNQQRTAMYTAEMCTKQDRIQSLNAVSDECSKCTAGVDDKMKDIRSEIAKNESLTIVSEKSFMEKSEDFRKMESIEKSTDGSVQIQRKRTVTEEMEHTQKSQELVVERSNVTQCFRNVRNPEDDTQHVIGLHITSPNRIKHPFSKSAPGSAPPVLTTVCQKVGKDVPCKKEEPPIYTGPIVPKFDATTLPQPKTIPETPMKKIEEKKPPIPVKHVPAPGSSAVNQSINPNDSPSGVGATGGRQIGAVGVSPKRGRGVLNAAQLGGRIPLCGHCHGQIRGPFITALGKIWCPSHFICATSSCRRPLQDLGFVEEEGQLYCEYCFEQYLAPNCSKCGSKIKGDCLRAIGKSFHPECFNCVHCGKLFGNSPFFLEDGSPYCETDWNELFTTKCFACGFPVEAGDRWVEALNNNYHSQCFNCTMCKKNLEGQSFFAKGGRPYCKNHAR